MAKKKGFILWYMWLLLVFVERTGVGFGKNAEKSGELNLVGLVSVCVVEPEEEVAVFLGRWFKVAWEFENLVDVNGVFVLNPWLGGTMPLNNW